MRARLLDTHAIAAFLDRVAPLSGEALHEAFVCTALEGGGVFRVTSTGRAVLTLYRISATGPGEDAAIDAWIARARQVVACP